MTKLTSKARNKLPASSFALPKERKYPVDTKARAVNAKARAAQEVAKGNLSSSQKAKVDSKANKVIARSKKK